MGKTEMQTYIVTFETQEDIDYNQIVQYLERHEKSCKIHKYCWAVHTGLSAVDIRNAIGKIVSYSVRVFVVRSGVEAAWRNSHGDQYDNWLKKWL